MFKSRLWCVVLSMTFMAVYCCAAARTLQAKEGVPIQVPSKARIKSVDKNWFIYPSGDAIGGDPIVETTSSYTKAVEFNIAAVPQWVEMYRITDSKGRFMCISGDSDGPDLYVEMIAGRSSCIWQFVPTDTGFLLRMVGSSRFVWVSGHNMGGGSDNYAIEAGAESHANKNFAFVTQ